MSPLEVGNAADRGEISDTFRTRIMAELTAGNDVLPPAHAALAIKNLTK